MSSIKKLAYPFRSRFTPRTDCCRTRAYDEMLPLPFDDPEGMGHALKRQARALMDDDYSTDSDLTMDEPQQNDNNNQPVPRDVAAPRNLMPDLAMAAGANDNLPAPPAVGPPANLAGANANGAAPPANHGAPNGNMMDGDDDSLAGGQFPAEQQLDLNEYLRVLAINPGNLNSVNNLGHLKNVVNNMMEFNNPAPTEDEALSHHLNIMFNWVYYQQRLQANNLPTPDNEILALLVELVKGLPGWA
jgi:hypothetical protein